MQCVYLSISALPAKLIRNLISQIKKIIDKYTSINADFSFTQKDADEIESRMKRPYRNKIIYVFKLRKKPNNDNKPN